MREGHLTSPLPLSSSSFINSSDTAGPFQENGARETRTDTAHTASLWRGEGRPVGSSHFFDADNAATLENNVVLLNKGDTSFFFITTRLLSAAQLPPSHH